MHGGPGDEDRALGLRNRPAPADTTEDFLFHLYRGSELLQDNRLHEAKEELDHALRLSPNDAKGQDLLAVVYFRLGLYPRAIEIYEELRRDFPNDAPLVQNLSLSYLKIGEPQKARALLEQLVLSQPDHLRAWSYLGLVHERMADYDKARAAFERAAQPGMARRMAELSISRPSDSPRSLPTEADGATTRRSEPPWPDVVSAPQPNVPAEAPPVPSRPPSAIVPHRLISVGVAAPLSAPTSLAPPRPDTAPPHNMEAIPSLAALTRDSTLAFPQDAGLFLHPSGLLLARFETSFAARLSNLQLMAAGSEGILTSPLFRRMRNRSMDEPLGGAESPMVLFSGAGSVALAPEGAETLFAFRLEGDFLFLREAVLLAFESSLTYENGRLAAFEGEAVVLVQLRGRGGVVLRTKGAVVTTAVNAEQSAVLARDSILGWAGRLLPRELAKDEAPGGVPGLISFAGEGTVLAVTALPGSHP